MGAALKLVQSPVVVSIMTVKAFESMLSQAGYELLPESTRGLGKDRGVARVWSAVHNYVLVSSKTEDVILGTGDGRKHFRTTLRKIDQQTLLEIREDRWQKR